MATSTFLAANRVTSSGTSYKFTGHSVGSYSAGAKVLIAVVAGYSALGYFDAPGVEMDGVAMRLLRLPGYDSTSSFGGSMGWFIADHPGPGITTADFEIFSTVTREAWSIASYQLTGASDYLVRHSPQAINSSASSTSATLKHTTGDLLFGISHTRSSSVHYSGFASGVAASSGTTSITGAFNSWTNLTSDGIATISGTTTAGNRAVVTAMSLVPITIPQVGDPNWDDVVLLIEPLQGFRGQQSTYVVDKSQSAHSPFTFDNDVILENPADRANASPAGITFDGNNDRFSLPDSNDWALGGHTDPWTIETKVYLTNRNAARHLVGQWSGVSAPAWHLWQNGSYVIFEARTASNTNWSVSSNPTVFPIGEAIELTVDHDGSGVVRIYYNGSMIGKGSPADTTVRNVALALFFGGDLEFSSDWIGNINGVRITKGVARYASDSGYTAELWRPWPAFGTGDTITSVTPSSGVGEGGTPVTLIGLGFLTATDVLFDGNSASSITVVDDTEITCVTPPGAVGLIDVEVVRPTTNILGEDAFTYISAYVDDIDPPAGGRSGGTSVTITGDGFTDVTGVLFDGNPATSVTVVDRTEITCDTPSGTPGFVDVTIEHPDGDVTVTGGFEYLGPTILGVIPLVGVRDGGTAFTITGASLTGATEVLFDSTPATSFSVIDDSTITGVSPAHSVGLVDVTVEVGVENAVAPNAFEYVSLIVDDLQPAIGSPAGGTTVTITGEGFTNVSGVLFDTDPGTDFVVVSSSEITIKTPAGSVGLVDVTVQHPDGDVVLEEAFEYLELIDYVSQIPINVASLGYKSGRVSQLPLNVIYVPQKPGSLTQLPINTSFLLEPIPPRALLPQWPVEETWSWVSSVLKSFSGREQRMAVRREPQQSYSYNLAILDEVDRQTMLYTFWRQIGRPFNYPLFVYRVSLDADHPAGSMEIEVDLSVGNFRPGEAICLFNVDLSLFQILETTGFGSSPDRILLSSPLPIDIPEGTMTCPAPICRIDDGQTLNMAHWTGAANVRFAATHIRTLLRPGQPEPVVTFDGLPLLPEKYVSSQVREQLVRNLETLDNNISDPRDFRSWYYPQIQTSRTFVVETEDLDYWRDFGNRIKGSRGTFLAPSFRSDFSLSVVPALGASRLKTEDIYVADYFRSSSDKYLRIETANGVIYRKISDVLLNMDRTADILLASPLGMTAGSNIISKLSIVYRARLSDDRIILRHHPYHTEISMAIATVEQ